MAEQEPVAAQAQEEEDDMPDSKYKAPAQKSLNEIVEQDKDDESLVKYKQTLLAGGDTSTVIEPNNPSRVIVKKLAVCVEGRPAVELDLTNVTEKHRVVLKEKCEYKIQVLFYVQHEIVTGLKYHQVAYRKGIKVDKDTYMVGSYAPNKEMHCFTSPVDEAPSGMLARGDYTMKSRFVDDDGNEYLAWEWTLSIKKDFD